MSRILGRLRVRQHNIAITMAVLVLLAQLILTLHGAAHLPSAGQDHCEIAQLAHSFAAQLPSIPFQIVAHCLRQPPQSGGLPAFVQLEPPQGPPIRAPPSVSPYAFIFKD
ncbi:MAG: hypothetical protein J5I81_11195 [Nitrococcus mobilis]|nr:hypothetical protein [Nitrococcus mobilis]